jgi:predicted RNase H-like nuclease (RuvC/YqgF family)
LNGQIRDLELENRKLERQNRDIRSEISDLKSERALAVQLSSSLATADAQVADLTKVLQSKTAYIAELTAECESLEKSYQLLSEVRSKDAETVATKQMEITRLQQELDQLKQSGRVGIVEAESRNRFRGIPEPERAIIPMRRQLVTTPPAMKVNLVFGDDQPSFRAARDLFTDQMSDTELQTRYQILTKEKEEKERILNRVAPKGAKFARVRIEKEQLEQEVMELNPQIAKIKSEMNKRGIY